MLMALDKVNYLDPFQTKFSLGHSTKMLLIAWFVTFGWLRMGWCKLSGPPECLSSFQYYYGCHYGILLDTHWKGFDPWLSFLFWPSYCRVVIISVVGTKWKSAWEQPWVNAQIYFCEFNLLIWWWLFQGGQRPKPTFLETTSFTHLMYYNLKVDVKFPREWAFQRT